MTDAVSAILPAPNRYASKTRSDPSIFHLVVGFIGPSIFLPFGQGPTTPHPPHSHPSQSQGPSIDGRGRRPNGLDPRPPPTPPSSSYIHPFPPFSTVLFSHLFGPIDGCSSSLCCILPFMTRCENEKKEERSVKAQTNLLALLVR